MKLFKVKLRGQLGSSVSVNFSTSYVVAENSHKAFLRLQDYLERNGIGFDKDRELESVTLLAETGEHPNCGTILFL